MNSNCFRPFQTDNGYLTESQWFARRAVNIPVTTIDTDAKIIDQKLTMKCNGIEYKTWDKVSHSFNNVIVY